MMGPDYTQCHGMMEVADRFYTKFVPEVKLNEVLNSDMHRWSIGKMPEEEKAARKKASEEFQKRYAQ